MLAEIHIVDAIAALRFNDARPHGICRMSDEDWQEFLPVSDVLHLTIPLRRACGDDLPKWVCNRIDKNICDNAKRFEWVNAAYLDVAEALRRKDVEHLVLKGFSHAPDFVEDARLRMQSDLDLYCPPDSISRARDALVEIGYEAEQGLEHQPTDHLPSMSKKNAWQWSGNAFDPEMPLKVELHFRFWNESTTGLNLKGVDQFWHRRVERRTDSTGYLALGPVDRVGYAALHVFHHLQMGALVPSHAYELAYFLDRSNGDERFWNDWRALHHDSLRRVQAVAFKLAASWFACTLPEVVMQEIQQLPAGVHRWFDRYWDSPLKSIIRPNKDSLWLHLSMLESGADRFHVFCQSLLPVHVPPRDALRTWSLATFLHFIRYACSRFAYHTYVFPGTVAEGLRWWRSAAQRR